MRRHIEKALNERSHYFILSLLALFSFTESIVFPIPIDIFTLGLSSLNPKKWKSYFFVATVFSVLGAVLAYLLGIYFSSFAMKIIHFFHYESFYEKVSELFQNSPFWVIFTSAFTPIPYKVFTISAGLMKIPFLPFLFASVIGRGLRFFIESYLGMNFGLELAQKKMKKVNLISLLLVSIVFVFFFVFYLFFN